MFFYWFLLIVLRFLSLCSFQWDHWGSSVAGRHSGLLWPALARSCRRVYPGIPQIQWISTPVSLLNNIVAYCEHLWSIFSFIHHIQLILRFHCDFQEGYLSVAAFAFSRLWLWLAAFPNTAPLTHLVKSKRERHCWCGIGPDFGRCHRT